jgi:cupin fold WbuC family metalloprotein
MTKTSMITPDVFVTEERYPSVGREDVDRLQAALPGSSRGRVRLCAHKDNADRMHEMFIAFDGQNYVRPSRHLGKDESLHMLEGAGDYFFFDAGGQVTDVVSLGTYDSEHQFYCRIPEGADHALLIRSDRIAIHETTPGPFRREDTVFTPWSPAETDADAARAFLETLRRHPRSRRAPLKMKQISEEVYVADEPIVSVGRQEMDFLKARVGETRRKRVRLCAHKDIENTLHEMFVVYMDMTYVRPNMHINKDESLHILEGEADFIFFDDHGVNTVSSRRNGPGVVS